MACGRGELGASSARDGARGGSGGGGGRGARRRLLRLDSLSEDSAYDAWLADRVDKGAAAALLLGYVLAVTLIYCLQSGYVQVFPA